MECAIFGCPPAWEGWLPTGTLRICVEELWPRNWPLLALTPAGAAAAEARCWRAAHGQQEARCRILLTPGECSPALLECIQADAVVTYGLSPRDSLTLSSLTAPVLCVQRLLPRLDGALIEPQEFPLPPLPAPAEELLPLLGLWLLQMPLTDTAFLW